MDFFCPSDPVFEFDTPKHPERLYNELPTTRDELAEWCKDYYTLMIQAMMTQDETRAKLAQQGLYHVQYRLIKIKAYHESSDFVEQYERQVPCMKWEPSKIVPPPFLTSLFMSPSSASPDSTRCEDAVPVDLDSAPVSPAEPVSDELPVVAEDSKESEVCSEIQVNPDIQASESVATSSVVASVERTTIDSLCEACESEESQPPRKRRRRGRGSRQKALKRYLLSAASVSELPRLGEMTFEEFETSMCEKRGYRSSYRDRDYDKAIPPSGREAVEDLRPLTAREEELREIFLHLYQQSDRVSLVPELHRPALYALESVAGVHVECGRDFQLLTRFSETCIKSRFSPVTSGLQEFLGSMRFSAYYY